MITLEQSPAYRYGKTFSDVVGDEEAPFEKVLEFFNDEARQRRMEDSESHHDRPPLAGVFRELESLPGLSEFFETLQRKRTARFKQAIGVLLRMIMESRGWTTTGKKGSLGVRAGREARLPSHDSGGLALWFLRAERYLRSEGCPTGVSGRAMPKFTRLNGKTDEPSSKESVAAPVGQASKLKLPR